MPVERFGLRGDERCAPYSGSARSGRRPVSLTRARAAGHWLRAWITATSWVIFSCIGWTAACATPSREGVGLGASFGTPAVANLCASYKQGHAQVRLSGGYWGVVGGAQLALEAWLRPDSLPSPAIALVGGYVVADRYLIAYSSPQEREHISYVGMTFGIRLRHLFADFGLAANWQHGTSSLAPTLEMGYQHHFGERR